MDACAERMLKSIESGLLDRMEYYQTPGVSIAVINNSKIEWSKGFGVCELETRKPVTENTCFQAGSVSKTVFAFAVMCLVQQGLISLDKDVSTYLKDWSFPKTIDGWCPKVTMRQLLSHTAGINLHGFIGYKQTEELPGIIQLLNGEPPSNTRAIVADIIPGMQYRYSGGGYTAAQKVFTDIAGKSFSDIMNDMVFGPLNMKRSCYEHPLSIEKAHFAASGYYWNYRPVEGGWYNYPHHAAGGLWTTATDLARLGIELQASLQGKSKILKKELAVEMVTPQVESHYGLGIRISGEGDTKHIYHYGGTQGFSSVLMLYRDLGIGAAVMINSSHDEFIDEILNTIANAYDWPQFMLKKIAKEKLTKKEMLGRYITQTGMDIEVGEVEEGYLTLTCGNQNPKMIFALSENVFTARTLNTEFEFKKDKTTGKVQLEITQNNVRHIADKIYQ